MPAQAGELLSLTADGADREALGAMAGHPLVVVRVDGDPALTQLAGLLRRRPCLSVGVADPHWWASDGGRSAPDLDVLLVEAPDPPAPWVGTGTTAALQKIQENALSFPTAVVALVQLLRLGPGLDLADALVAESVVYSMLQSGSSHQHWLRERPRRAPKPSQGPAILLQRSGSRDEVLVIELHRPEVRNAFSTEMRDQLVAAFDLASQDPTIERVEVRGAGPSFCSGGDLDEFGTAPEPPVAHLVRTSRSAAASLAACAERTTFFVHGASVGAGIELAALSGRVSADPGSSFCLPEVTMGLVPGAGGTATIPRRIGRQRTAYLAALAEPIDARTARSWGLVDELVARTGS